MRTILTILLAAAVAGSLAGEAAAKQNRTKSYSKHQGYGYRAPPPTYRYRAPPPYQERLLQSAPFGSQLWWELFEESRRPQ